jgi:hypothetical protein
MPPRCHVYSQGICRQANPIFKFTSELTTLENGNKCNGLGDCTWECRKCRVLINLDHWYTKKEVLAECKHYGLRSVSHLRKHEIISQLKCHLAHSGHCCADTMLCEICLRSTPSRIWCIYGRGCVKCELKAARRYYGMHYDNPTLWEAAQKVSFLLGLHSRVGGEFTSANVANRHC